MNPTPDYREPGWAIPLLDAPLIVTPYGEVLDPLVEAGLLPPSEQRGYRKRDEPARGLVQVLAPSFSSFGGSGEES